MADTVCTSTLCVNASMGSGRQEGQMFVTNPHIQGGIIRCDVDGLHIDCVKAVPEVRGTYLAPGSEQSRGCWDLREAYLGRKSEPVPESVLQQQPNQHS